ncbi:MAG: hypothetical protein ACRD8Z_19560, partial [Nitrososphaeraceae archaeon]
YICFVTALVLKIPKIAIVSLSMKLFYLKDASNAMLCQASELMKAYMIACLTIGGNNNYVVGH